MTQHTLKPKAAPQTPSVKVWRQANTEGSAWGDLIAIPRQVEGSPPPAGRLYCDMCGDEASELRWTGESNSRGKPCDPICPDCYAPQLIGGDDSTGFPPACGVMDGPCFDDLPLAQQGASK